MECYAGIDLSLTGTGLVVIDDDGKIIRQQLVSTTVKDIMEERLTIISREVINFLDDSVVAIGIEGLSYGSSGQAMLDLGGLNHLVRHYLYLAGRKYQLVPPTTVKKFVTGKGNCQKALMLLKVYKRWGIEFDNDNLADAYSIAQYVKEEYQNAQKNQVCST
ncbi:crossover junction endodeoxyribonuclease RuvC [Candidatus Pacearchaeota archaeon]|nr:crossover junction endodeoxyribonuclease RuvC [Candidatus Pacearchaeota archaeon]